MDDQIECTVTMVTYHSLNAPKGEAWAAFHMLNGRRLPMVFTGASEEIVVKAGESWWKEETTKVDRRTGKKEK